MKTNTQNYEPLTWREAQHYQKEFEKFIEAKLGKPAAKMVMDIWLMNLFQDGKPNDWGKKQINRARNSVKKFLPKFKAVKHADANQAKNVKR